MLGLTWVQAKGEEFYFTLRLDDPDNAVSVVEQVIVLVLLYCFETSLLEANLNHSFLKPWFERFGRASPTVNEIKIAIFELNESMKATLPFMPFSTLLVLS